MLYHCPVSIPKVCVEVVKHVPCILIFDSGPPSSISRDASVIGTPSILPLGAPPPSDHDHYGPSTATEFHSRNVEIVAYHFARSTLTIASVQQMVASRQRWILEYKGRYCKMSTVALGERRCKIWYECMPVSIVWQYSILHRCQLTSRFSLRRSETDTRALATDYIYHTVFVSHVKY